MNSSKKHIAWPIIYSTVVFSFGYAIIRYHIAGAVPWKDLPFFITNKAIAMGSLILLVVNFGLAPLSNLGIHVSGRTLRSRRLIGIVGFIMAFIHMLMSLLLFKPAIYNKFFEHDGTITLFAGLSMLGGVLSFIFIWIYNISFNSNFRKDQDLINFISSKWVIIFAMCMGGIHLFFMGIEGWMNPAGWNGGMPPISLVSFAFFGFGFIINLLGRDK